MSSLSLKHITPKLFVVMGALLPSILWSQDQNIDDNRSLESLMGIPEPIQVANLVDSNAIEEVKTLTSELPSSETNSPETNPPETIVPEQSSKDTVVSEQVASDTLVTDTLDSVMQSPESEPKVAEPKATIVEAPSPQAAVPEPLTRLDATRITGRKKQSRLEKQNGSVTHLGKDVILQTQPIGTQELLEKVPGVQSASDDGMGNSRLSIGIRGLNPRRSARVLVLEDGIPIQPAAYIYPNMYYNPPIERIEEVEILKGSGSILYGPQSMGGVVNYITSKPRRTEGGAVALSYGTQNLLSTYAEVGGFGNEEFQPEVQLLYKQGDGFRENNSFDQINGTFKLNWSPNEKEDWYFKMNYNKENTFATYTGLTEYSFEEDPWFNPKDQDVFEVDRFAIDLIKNDYSKKNWIATTKAYASWFNREWYRENDIYVQAVDYEAYLNDVISFDQLRAQDGNRVDPNVDYVRIGDRQNSFGILREFYTGGMEKSWLYDQGSQNELEFGFRGHFERFHNERLEGNSGVDGEFNVKDVQLTKMGDDGELVKFNGAVQSEVFETKALSLFIQERMQFGNFGLDLGSRFEVFEQQRVDLLNSAQMVDKTTIVYSEIDPLGDLFRVRIPMLLSLGTSYDLSGSNANDELMLFAGTHSGYTPPSASSLNPNLFDLSGGQDQGFDVRAEESWTSEIGIRGSSALYNFEAAFFQVDIENQLTIERSALLYEAARTQTRGFEFLGNLNFSQVENIGKVLPDLHTTYTLMNSEVISGKEDRNGVNGIELIDLSGNELAYTPRHTVLVGISKGLDLGDEQRLTFRVDWRYKSEAFADVQNIAETENLGIQGMIPATPHTAVDIEIPYVDMGLPFDLILPELVDLSMTYVHASEFEIFAAVKNIYDHTYIGSRLHSNPQVTAANISSGIIVAPGRQAQVGARVHF